MINNQELKKQYNYFIRRIENGIKYFEEHPKEVDKFMEDFQKLVYQSGEILIKLRGLGEDPSPDEILEGFKGVD